MPLLVKDIGMINKKITSFSLVGIFFISILLFLLNAYSELIRSHETTFIFESVQAIVSVFDVKPENVTQRVFENKNLIEISLPCNFNTSKLRDYISGYLTNEKYKVLTSNQRPFTLQIEKSSLLVDIKLNTEDPLAQIALLIDDVGYTLKHLYPYLELGIPVTFAVLPNEKNSLSTVMLIKNKGFEYLLHQPMEPNTYPKDNPGKYAFYINDSKEKIMKKFEHNLDSIGGKAIGVNNHMGSAFTANKDGMTAFLELVRDKNMFFIDSRTTKLTLGKKIAKELQVPYYENAVFLDNKYESKNIVRQLNKAQRLSLKRGKIVIIGHVYSKILAQEIKNIIPKFNDQRIKFITISEIFKNENISN